MSMEIFSPACGSSKELAAQMVPGEGGIGKTALVLNYLLHSDFEAGKNIFLSFNYDDLRQQKSVLHDSLEWISLGPQLIFWQEPSVWERYARPSPPRETPETSSYGQLFLSYSKNEYPAGSVELLDACRNADFGIFKPLSTGLPCSAENSTQFSFPGQVSIYLFLRQAYKLAAFLLAKLAAFFHTPVTSVKKAVSERAYFVVHETHPPAATALSSGLLAGAFRAS
jgi:hypothetical protein